MSIVFSNNTVSSGANGVNITGGAIASSTITAFSGNTISGTTVGSGILVSNATFDATGGAGYSPVAGGTTAIGPSGNPVGGGGMLLTSVAGDLSFTDLDIFNSNGTGLSASSAVAFTNDAAGTGFKISVGAGVATIDATGGPAVSLSTVTGTLPFVTVKSTNSSTTGVALNSFLGSFSAGSGSSISGSTGTGFQVGSSNATITYDGTINTTTGKGVDLTSNTGSTISFTGALTLSSGSNTAFNATGGGTVSASNTASTLSTTIGIALNVTNTTIGGSGLNFRSISSNGASSGIVLNATGAGSLTVIGDGASDPANTTRGQTTAKNGGGTITLGSGGTIQAATASAISLTSTAAVSLTSMNITAPSGQAVNSGANGITASTVSGLTLDNVKINGFTGNSGLRGSEVIGLSMQHVDIDGNGTATNAEVNDNWNVRLDNLTGTSSVLNSLFFNSREDIFSITNTDSSGAHALSLTITNSEFRDTDLGIAPAVGDTAFKMFLTGSSNCVTTINAKGSTFKNARLTGFQYNGSSANSSGTINVGGSVPANGNVFEGNGVDVDLSHQGTGTTLNFDVSSNTMRQTLRVNASNSININMGGLASGATMFGTIKSNVIGNPAVANSGSDLGAGIGIDAKGVNSTITATVSSNIVSQVKANSGNVFDAGTSQTGKLNLKITSNTFNGNPAQVNPQYGLHINAGTGTAGETNPLCVQMGLNSITMPASAIASIDLDSFPGSTTDLIGYTGAANNGIQIQNFFGSNGGTTPPGANSVTTPATLYTAAGGNQPDLQTPLQRFRVSIVGELKEWKEWGSGLKSKVPKTVCR